MNEQKKSIFSNHEIMCRALKDSFIKLNPRTQIKNPVMFMVFVSAILTFVMFLFSLAGIRDAAPGYILALSILRQGNRYRQTATWWKALRRWMRAPLPASQLQ